MHLADAFIQSDLQCIQDILFFFFISMCVPWELNPHPFALLTQCSTTEPQEHIETLSPRYHTIEIYKQFKSNNFRIRIRIRMNFIVQLCLHIQGICYSDRSSTQHSTCVQPQTMLSNSRGIGVPGKTQTP